MKEGFLQTAVPPRWSEMTPERAESDMAKALSEAQENLDKIKALRGKKNSGYMDTVRAFDRATDSLDRAWTYLNHLQSVADSPALRDVLNRLMPTVTDFYSSIDLDDELYAVIKDFVQSGEGKSLKSDKARLASETLLDFELSGANLPKDKKSRLREIDSQLAVKTQKFSENVLDGTKMFTLNITDEADLEGLPATAVAVAKKKADEKGMKGWLFTLEQPSYVPFMTYAKNDALREKLWREFSSVAANGKFSNWNLIREILALRDENAAILSRANFADLILERRMAKTGNAAEKFVDSLTEKFGAHFKSEWNELLDFARENGYLGANEKMPPVENRIRLRKAARRKIRFRPRRNAPLFSARIGDERNV